MEFDTHPTLVPNPLPGDHGSIPNHTYQSLFSYIVHGLSPGGFVTAVLENDLQGAVARADDYNQAHLVAIVRFVAQHLPIGSYGSKENVRRWMNNHPNNRSRSDED